jgi:hypothetical protein
MYSPSPAPANSALHPDRRLRDGKALLGLVVTLLLMEASCTDRIGDLRSEHLAVVRRFDTLTFHPERWRLASEAERGRMVADLARQRRLVGLKADEVLRLLGKTDCYVHYEDEPCYVVTLDRPRYHLEFGVNHSEAPGTVTSMWLTHH